MSTARLIIGDVHEVLASLPENSVDLVVTSPPFLALRSYLPADHPDKAKEIGSEPNPGEFIDALLDVVEACDRVLTPHGSICIELGDTYSGSGGAGGDYNASGIRAGQPKFRAGTPRWDGRPDGQVRTTTSDPVPLPERSYGPGWPEAKSLCLIPELFRLSLAYGRNPLTGRETPRWKVRNVVRWHRPNPPVGALGDKFRPATSDMVIACHARDRYFDLDAVRTKDGPGGNATRRSSLNRDAPGQHTQDARDLVVLDNPNGAPPLDTWVIPTAPYKGSHYATFPPALVVKPILSMCPERVCRTCGEPSRRITEPGHVDALTGEPVQLDGGDIYASDVPREQRGMQPRNGGHARANSSPTTVGWTDCGHDDWRKGVVLDPFAGSGTTLSVATGHGRNAIGIDIDSRNADLCRDRVGMFLEVSELAKSTPREAAI